MGKPAKPSLVRFVFKDLRAPDEAHVLVAAVVELGCGGAEACRSRVVSAVDEGEYLNDLWALALQYKSERDGLRHDQEYPARIGQY
ncbi:uncharacterized protein H6S33_003264 [Morchella sextelata]|uniref:uncharacterized protein n=1 Tax=Morchella sextelata TaxID=1174677 RepID=UPI001D03F183|nr:uncharacterized protein H6S33_003264 [Morchella sextelata]KAH0607276.1 hypothetical protein H6S33_003264 [Morchella sextelata]